MILERKLCFDGFLVQWPGISRARLLACRLHAVVRRSLTLTLEEANECCHITPYRANRLARLKLRQCGLYIAFIRAIPRQWSMLLYPIEIANCLRNRAITRSGTLLQPAEVNSETERLGSLAR